MLFRRPPRTFANSGAVLATCSLLAMAACTAISGDAPVARVTTDRPAETASANPTRPAPVNDDPARLLGLDAARLAALFGDPVRVRRDGTAEIRQFGAESTCQVDAFLYPDDGIARVTHVEVRRGLNRLAGADARACLRTLLGAAATS